VDCLEGYNGWGSCLWGDFMYACDLRVALVGRPSSSSSYPTHSCKTRHDWICNAGAWLAGEECRRARLTMLSILGALGIAPAVTPIGKGSLPGGICGSATSYSRAGPSLCCCLEDVDSAFEASKTSCPSSISLFSYSQISFPPPTIHHGRLFSLLDSDFRLLSFRDDRTSRK
jgi:hypothetical protein